VTDAHIEDVSARAFTIPTDAPESDGTLEWESTTLVLATVRSGEPTGIGWTYGHAATAAVIGSDLAGAVQGRDALDVPGAWAAMVAAIRDLPYFEQMLAAEAVDVLQADVTRCGGITELLRVDALCRARSRRLSLHCAPTIHAHAGVALTSVEHLEYFHDHVRVEEMLFEGAPQSRGSELPANAERPRPRRRAA
jgi:L-alanine-DL-glutamate epimerase-like enolase superfamily enzyme